MCENNVSWSLISQSESENIHWWKKLDNPVYSVNCHLCFGWHNTTDSQALVWLSALSGRPCAKRLRAAGLGSSQPFGTWVRVNPCTTGSSPTRGHLPHVCPSVAVPAFLSFLHCEIKLKKAKKKNKNETIIKKTALQNLDLTNWSNSRSHPDN